MVTVGAVPAVLVFKVTRLTLTQRLSVARKRWKVATLPTKLSAAETFTL